jgi:hypothetical protein
MLQIEKSTYPDMKICKQIGLGVFLTDLHLSVYCGLEECEIRKRCESHRSFAKGNPGSVHPLRLRS